MPRNPNKIDYSGGLPDGYEAFQILEDPRTGGHKKHHFGEILFMSITAMLCGMDCFSQIEDFCDAQEEWLRKWITLPNGIPRAQTFYNTFCLIAPKRFNDCLRAHLGSISPQLRDQIIAIDGKSLRGSHTLKQGALHVVSAWSCEQRLTICQDHVADKQNEIAAMARILDLLDLEGHTITIDAMGTQREFARKIITKKGDYLFALKGNQGRLHKEAIDHFDFALRHLNLKEAMKTGGWSLHQERNRGHNRDTLCSLVATDKLGWMDSEIRDQWEGLRSLIVIENETTECDTGRKRKPERRYYLSSLPADGAKLRALIRAHWGIENNCHWTLDTCFKEDANQTSQPNAAKNLGTLRRIVLNLLNHDKGTIKSMPRKRLQALMNVPYRERILSLA